MKRKQTAVEWLMEQITYDNGYGQRWISFKEDTDLNIYFQDAKAIEEEQIIAANEDCSTNELGELLTGEQYYTSTYE